MKGSREVDREASRVGGSPMRDRKSHARPRPTPTRTPGGASAPPATLARSDQRSLRKGERTPAVRRTTAQAAPVSRSTRAAPSPPQGSRQPWLPFWGSTGERARLRPELITRRLVHVGIALLAVLLMMAAGMVVYHLSSGLRLFALRTVDVRGVEQLTREEVEATVRELLPEGVLRADLAHIRDSLRRHELVEDVEVTRLLPDMIRIVLRERVPVTLARRADGSLACVDRNGVLFGRATCFVRRPLPPLLVGLLEPQLEGADPATERMVGDSLGVDATPMPSESLEPPTVPEARSLEVTFNRRRVEAYQQVLADLDRGFPTLSPRLDEVHIDESEDVRVVLSEPKTTIYLGREDYRQRLNAALDVLEAVARRDVETLGLLRLAEAEKLLGGARITYLNAKVPRRIVVGLNN
jgi:hypothetical protein